MTRFIAFCLLAVLMLTLSDTPAQAQFYETVQRPDLQWFELHTPHFRVIYHEGFEESARRTARLMERDYERIRQLTGGSLFNFPVIINGYNDRSNGYMAPMNFRVEIETPPLSGKALNPRTGGHLENLAAHELVHALHYSVRGGYTSFLHVFSPDQARTVHGFVPLGFTEGFAVFIESDLLPGRSGRGNFAPFVRQFDANFATSDRWDLGSMVTPTTSSWPINRFYNAGYHLTDYIVETYGEEAIATSLKNYARFPLLGYPLTLYRTIGTAPRQMYRDFEAHTTQRENLRLESLREAGLTELDPVAFNHLRGPNIHQPRWISQDEVLYYGRFYNAPSGFWIYNTSAQTHRLLYRTNIHESYQYDLSRDASRILFARYSPHLFHDNREFSDIHELDIQSGRAVRITREMRLNSPAFSGQPDEIMVLENDFDTFKWSALYADSLVTVAGMRPNSVVQVAVNPVHRGLMAVVANKNGVQGIWLVHRGFEKDVLVQGPDIAFEDGSLFDVHWHPDGLRLLFSGERNGVMNVYEYDYYSDELFQQTRTAYNAMEAGYSPDGERIVLVKQDGDFRSLAVLNRDAFLYKPVDRTVWQSDLSAIWGGPRLGDELIDASEDWEIHEYNRDRGWLKPRAVIPTLGYTSTFNRNLRAGLELSSVDVLRQNAYTLELSASRHAFFYDMRYRYSGVFPTLQARSAFNAYQPGGNLQEGFRFFGQEQIYSISAPMVFRFDDPALGTALFVEPGFQHSASRIQARRPGESAVVGETDWISANRLRLSTTLNFRLRQHLRDAQPNTGFRLYAQTDFDINSESQNGPFRGFRTGIQLFAAPLQRFNQSLMLRAEIVRQNRFGYNLPGILHEGFDVAGINFESQNLAILSGRYTIPLSFPERGGYILPLYLERIYGVLFAETFGYDAFRNPISLVGGGIRFRVRFIYNVPLDLGFGMAFLPDRNWEEAFVINF